MRKGTTFEEVLGIEKARVVKEKIRVARARQKVFGMVGKKHKEESKLKMIQSHIGQKSCRKGLTLEEEYGIQKATQIRNRIKELRAKQITTEETRKKMSESQKGHYGWMTGKPAWNRGVPMKEESRMKLSIKNKGKMAWNKDKKMSDKFCKRMKEWRAERVLPVKDTRIEVKIQNMLKLLGYDFFTHQYIRDIEHGYQCDILIPALNMVIECDGNYWHNYPIGKDIDKVRTSELIQNGFKVLRLWESEIMNMDICDLQERIDKVRGA